MKNDHKRVFVSDKWLCVQIQYDKTIQSFFRDNIGCTNYSANCKCNSFKKTRKIKGNKFISIDYEFVLLTWYRRGNRDSW
jgi:hypothetical protein